LHHSIVSVILL